MLSLPAVFPGMFLYRFLSLPLLFLVTRALRYLPHLTSTRPEYLFTTFQPTGVYSTDSSLVYCDTVSSSFPQAATLLRRLWILSSSSHSILVPYAQNKIRQGLALAHRQLREPPLGFPHLDALATALSRW